MRIRAIVIRTYVRMHLNHLNKDDENDDHKTCYQ
jgi:hypothetical protein